VVCSPRTTPGIHATAATIGSADFCLSLRLLIGHVHHLVTNHPDLDFLLVPYLCSEDGERTTTCSKHRDAGGVALRSLTRTLDHLIQHSPPAARRAAVPVLESAGVHPSGGLRLPVLLQPYVWSLEREAMFNVCFGVYCDVFGISPAARMVQPLVPRSLRRYLAPYIQRCLEPFAVAYETIMHHDAGVLNGFLPDERAVRVALVGRHYLIGEPLLTCDLKAWFLKAGASVITPADLRPEDLQPGPGAPQIFYDSHWLFDAMVEFLAPHVDGFIFAGSFGCHPDAFILDLLLDRARQMGIPAWLFRYDEQAGSAGFQTRYETILRFLEQRRDRRLAGRTGPVANTTVGPQAPVGHASRVPLITWPYMSDGVELVMRELAHQAGLTRYILPPRPISETTLGLGSETFPESCCPYAFSTGSLAETLAHYFRAHPEGPPRRIVVLMARGAGPCSFGLYLHGQARDLPEVFRETLARGGHTLEFVSISLSDANSLIRELADLGDQQRLAPVAAYMRMLRDGSLTRMPPWRRWAATRRLWSTVSSLLIPVRAKMAAFEETRARALIRRAHETLRGQTNEVSRRSLAHLAEAHTVPAIRAARDQALDALADVPQDQQVRPRVAVVGEIYVVGASFANRGVIDTLLSGQGLEVVEGTTLSSLVAIYEREIRRRARVNIWPLRPILQALWRRNILVLHRLVEGEAAKPFMNLGVGGEGNISVAHARRLLEEEGVDGIVHLFPFKCMPEGMAKAPLAEICRLYGVPYLPLSFNRELEIERAKTEIATFAALVHARTGRLAAEGREAHERARGHEIARRRAISQAVNGLYRAYRRGRFAVA